MKTRKQLRIIWDKKEKNSDDTTFEDFEAEYGDREYHAVTNGDRIKEREL